MASSTTKVKKSSFRAGRGSGGGASVTFSDGPGVEPSRSGAGAGRAGGVRDFGFGFGEGVGVVAGEAKSDSVSRAGFYDSWMCGVREECETLRCRRDRGPTADYEGGGRRRFRRTYPAAGLIVRTRRLASR